MINMLKNKIMQLFVANPGSDYSTNEVTAFAEADKEKVVEALDLLVKGVKLEKFCRNYFMERVAYYRLAIDVVCTVCGERYGLDHYTDWNGEYIITVFNNDGEDDGVWNNGKYICQACNDVI